MTRSATCTPDRPALTVCRGDGTGPPWGLYFGARLWKFDCLMGLPPRRMPRLSLQTPAVYAPGCPHTIGGPTAG